MEKPTYRQGPQWNAAWEEYDAAAKWCAQRGIKGKYGDDLPANMSVKACELIDEDIDAFQRHVKATAYAIAMEGVFPDE